MSPTHQSTNYVIQALAKNHATKSFDCGEPALNEYLQRYALKNAAKGVGKAYVAVPASQQNYVHGFYTISAGSISFKNLPPDNAKGMPKYPIPVARLGRMGVLNSSKGQGLGTFLLSDAMHRVLTTATSLGIYALVVDSKNADAKKFYLRFGFIEFQDMPLSLFLPVATIAQSTSS